MQIQDKGIIRTGVDVVDQGITDLEATIIEGELHLYSTSGRYGGIASYRVGSEGDVTTDMHIIYPPWISRVVSDKLAVLESDEGRPVILVGENELGLYGYAVLDTGRMQGRLTRGVNADAQINDFATLDARVEVTDTPINGYPEPSLCGQIRAVGSAEINGQTYVLVACGEQNAVVAMRQDASSGALTQTDIQGAEQGLGIAAPTDVETVQVGGETFVILSAAGSSSLSVLRLSPSGQLTPTDHMLDNGSTRFENVQALASAQVGDFAFVVAGGGDNGLSLYQVLPNGTLLHISTIADTSSTSLHKVTALDMEVQGNELHIFAGSQNDMGISHFVIDTTTLGNLQKGTGAADQLTGDGLDDVLMAIGENDSLSGGGGDDVLMTGDSGTVLTGGQGRDGFVVLKDSGTTTITDFQTGQDHLDLTDLPMLRDVAQLEFVTTSSGARISYRGHVVEIQSANGQPLSPADVFPDGLVGGDRIWLGPYDDIDDPGEDEADLGELLEGGSATDSLQGTDRDDTIRGFGGRDTLSGGEGHDLIEGGKAHDKIRGDAGNDSLYGNDHGDTIWGGDGDDLIDGGSGPNRLFGDAGNDTLIGGEQVDRISGGDGDDYIVDAGGKNLIYPGHGENKVYSGDGDDWINAGRDDDYLNAGNGNNTVIGARGDDTLVAGTGNDSLYGKLNDDLLEAEGGDNQLWLGWGDDTASSGDGNDIFYGARGNDVMSSSGGNNMFYLGVGDDIATGGAGRDTIKGDKGNDLINGGGGDDLLEGASGRDTVQGGSGNDSIRGDADNDFLLGGAGNDTLLGGGQDDMLRGDDGDDFLIGGGGDDQMHGGDGSDRFRGGAGSDEYWGGDGADVFEFFKGSETGTIKDFSTSDGDVLKLSRSIWSSLGTLSAQQIIDRFAVVDENENIVLDFSDVRGCVIILEDFDDLDRLDDQIEFM